MLFIELQILSEGVGIMKYLYIKIFKEKFVNKMGKLKFSYDHFKTKSIEENIFLDSDHEANV